MNATIIPFPEKEKEEPLAVWMCACDGVEFLLLESGAVECVKCGDRSQEWYKKE